MCFQQMTKLTDRGFVGDRLMSQVNTNEAPHRPRVAQGFFHRRVRQVESVLQEVDAQHSLHTNRPAACAFRLWVKWLNHLTQIAPRDNLIHFVEK
jgi:hypothetical protein